MYTRKRIDHRRRRRHQQHTYYPPSPAYRGGRKEKKKRETPGKVSGKGWKTSCHVCSLSLSLALEGILRDRGRRRPASLFWGSNYKAPADAHGREILIIPVRRRRASNIILCYHRVVVFILIIFIAGKNIILQRAVVKTLPRIRWKIFATHRLCSNNLILWELNFSSRYRRCPPLSRFKRYEYIYKKKKKMNEKYSWGGQPEWSDVNQMRNYYSDESFRLLKKLKKKLPN